MNNTVELLGFYGNDEVIACSAWTSTSRALSEEKRSRIPNMIRTLWMDGHETPFEKGSVHFLVNTEIASHIHYLKHRISSFNGESARYKELKEDKYYVPEDWKGIQLSEDLFLHDPNTGEEMSWKAGESDWADVMGDFNEIANYLYHKSLVDVTAALGRKRAKESCRFFKPYASQIEGDVSFNIRSFANFLKLRNDEHAQKEIRELAVEMLRLVQEIPGNPFEHTLNAIQERIDIYKKK